MIVPPQFNEGAFINPGSGGCHKGKNPNVPIEQLKMKWVNGADILYIGRAGGIEKNGKSSNSNLKRRIKSLLEFGNGKNVGHWGGRYLWQFANSQELLVYWFVCSDDENAVVLEKNFIHDFKRHHGKLPFANLRE